MDKTGAYIYIFTWKKPYLGKHELPDLCREGLWFGWDAAWAWQALAAVQSLQSADLAHDWLDGLIPSIIYIWGSDYIQGKCSEGTLAFVPV